MKEALATAKGAVFQSVSAAVKVVYKEGKAWGKRRYHFVLAILALCVAGCGGYNNNTAVDGAKLFVQAMVEHDSKLMEYINHSNQLMYPARRQDQRCYLQHRGNGSGPEQPPY